MVRRSSLRGACAMSPSMRSKPVSESSRVTGATDPERDRPGSGTAAGDGAAAAPTAVATEPPDEGGDDDRTDQTREGGAAGKRSGKPMRPTQIELEVSRQRAAGWMVFGLGLGALLILSLGTVGVWAGVLLVVTGAYHGWQLIQTLMHAPGTIEISDREISLPRGLCMPRPVVVAPKDITAVYFLRRSVPWNRAAPVLVIELGAKAMAFPRDWFASEADQRHRSE